MQARARTDDGIVVPIAMDATTTVPQQHDRAGNFCQQVEQEALDIWTFVTAPAELEIEDDVAALG